MLLFRPQLSSCVQENGIHAAGTLSPEPQFVNKCAMFTTLRTLFACSNAGAFRQQDQSALSFSMSADRFLFRIAADGQIPICVCGQGHVGEFSNLKARMGVFLF
jgi:hypothetical protein